MLPDQAAICIHPVLRREHLPRYAFVIRLPLLMNRVMGMGLSTIMMRMMTLPVVVVVPCSRASGDVVGMGGAAAEPDSAEEGCHSHRWCIELH